MDKRGYVDSNCKPSPFNRARIKLGWTYARLGEESGLTLKQVWDVLHGHGVTQERITAIKDAIRFGRDPNAKFAAAMAGRRFA